MLQMIVYQKNMPFSMLALTIFHASVQEQIYTGEKLLLCMLQISAPHSSPCLQELCKETLFRWHSEELLQKKSKKCSWAIKNYSPIITIIISALLKGLRIALSANLQKHLALFL